ncbi:uncharacterized protein AB675_5348 [Cyphellophora attinorum]|uniref:Uncharacterized protein n=1 Tax=Cyphellophora attinorum TaxID=1664694 RepID=A0A0N1HCD5_9EURO|nr:uncharacterized protein AB675_5348 [Phialophora attinorum]KPI41966.1 hypothetical protein AB675_5348 [Phialophora attinorum]
MSHPTPRGPGVMFPSAEIPQSIETHMSEAQPFLDDTSTKPAFSFTLNQNSSTPATSQHFPDIHPVPTGSFEGTDNNIRPAGNRAVNWSIPPYSSFGVPHAEAGSQPGADVDMEELTRQHVKNTFDVIEQELSSVLKTVNAHGQAINENHNQIELQGRELTKQESARVIMNASINAVRFDLDDLKVELATKDKQRAAREKQQALQNEEQLSEAAALKSRIDNLGVAASVFQFNHEVHHGFRVQQEAFNSAQNSRLTTLESSKTSASIAINKLERDSAMQEQARVARERKDRTLHLRVLELETKLASETNARIALEGKVASVENAIKIEEAARLALEADFALHKRSSINDRRQFEHDLAAEKDGRLELEDARSDLEADIAVLKDAQISNERSITKVVRQVATANDGTSDVHQELATLKSDVAVMTREQNELKQLRASFINARLAQATIIGNLNIVMRKGDAIENRSPDLSCQIEAKLSNCKSLSRLDELLGVKSASHFRQIFQFPQAVLAKVYRFTRAHLQRSSGEKIVMEGADPAQFQEWVESEAIAESVLLRAAIDIVVTTDAAVADRWRKEGKSVAKGLDNASIATSGVLSFI